MNTTRTHAAFSYALVEALTFFLLFAMALLVAGCSDGQAAEGPAETAAPPATRVEALTLEAQPFEDQIEVTGTVEAVSDATLSARASGTVAYVADLGTFVREGEAVARFDAREAQAAVEQARAQLESAEAQAGLAEDRFARQEPLYRDSVISAQEFESIRSERSQAQAAVSQARAALTQAEERLSQTRVTAPFAGTVEERFAERGEQIRTGDEVARVVDVRPAKVTAGVPERYAGDIEKGTTVAVRFGNAGLAPRTGAVTFVGSAINPESRTFPIEVELPNEDGRLKPEMVATLRVTRERLGDALVIPRAAVIRTENGPQVYTVAGADTATVARQQAVTLGAASGDLVVVTEGLQAGERVIVAGQTNVAEGDAVEVTDAYDRPAAAGTPSEGTAANRGGAGSAL